MHIATRDMCAVIEKLLEVVPSVWSLMRLYNEDNWTSQSNQLVMGSDAIRNIREPKENIVGSHYQAVTTKHIAN
jgi:hypothetical protein